MALPKNEKPEQVKYVDKDGIDFTPDIIISESGRMDVEDMVGAKEGYEYFILDGFSKEDVENKLRKYWQKGWRPCSKVPGHENVRPMYPLGPHAVVIMTMSEIAKKNKEAKRARQAREQDERLRKIKAEDNQYEASSIRVKRAKGIGE